MHIHIGVVRLERFVGGERLGAADVVVLVEDLALEVGDIHGVEVHDADGSHACEREVYGDRRAEPAGAHDEDFGRQQFALPNAADLGHDYVPAVALHLIGRERVERLGRRLRLRHCG